MSFSGLLPRYIHNNSSKLVLVAAVFISCRSFYKEHAYSIDPTFPINRITMYALRLLFGIKLGQCSKPNFVSTTIIDDFIVVYGQKKFHTKSAIEGFAPVSKLVLILK